MSIAQNYVKIRVFRGKEQAEVVAGTGISKQNISAWEANKNNPGKEFIDQLASFFDIPKEVFYMDPLNDDYLKDNFSAAKGTGVTKSQAEVEIDKESMYRNLVEANSAYRLVPKSILDEEYRIVPKAEMDEKAQMWREALDAKNALISQLEREIVELRSGKIALETQKA